MQKEWLKKYVDAVMAAPRSLSLTATTDPAEFWERHVLDALKILSLLPPSLHETPLKIIDVGSGNGIPGIPIAIATPKWELFLLDSNNKKIGFLDMFCKFNAIKNVHLMPGRAEELAHQESYREKFDIAFARALGKLPSALEFTAPFVKVGGRLIIPHGSSYQSEIKRAENAMNELGLKHRETVPYQLNNALGFFAVMYSKISSTPDRYPRKVGIPTKRPL